jgi:peptidyl-dipeptidase A
MKKILFISVLAISLMAACKQDHSKIQAEAQTFIDAYTEEYVKLYSATSEAQWKSNIEIIEGDSTNAKATEAANEAYAKFTGSAENIENAKKFLEHKKHLTELQAKQLEVILFAAGNNPQTVADLVKERIKAETAQTEKLFGYDFKLNGKSVSTNLLDEVLKTSNNLEERRKAWEASKEVGKGLKAGLTNLRRLRNETVKALGYNDYFSYQVSEYGMKTDEMMEMMRKLNKELRPLFRELHTYARYELAKKYGVKEVPDYIPADWISNRWAQDWSSMITVEGLDIDGILKTKSPEWIVKEGENFYKSLGYDALPASFWEKSSLYPLPEGSKIKKNNHASAWHMDLNKDVRSLMSVEPNAEWFETSNHELGHIYYYMTYTNADVPPLLRAGANRAYHEAMGSLMGLAATQKPFLVQRGLVDSNAKVDQVQNLLKEALNYAVFIPFAAGVMSEFEKSLYTDNLPADQFNKRWWELVKEYQGVVPPSERGEEYCDAATKTHINDDAAQYYDYALSYVILFQLHDHIAKNILKQDPRATNYWGNQEVGAFLKSIMYPGASKDWRAVLKEKTGEDLNAKAMVSYFEPLMVHLKEVNKGRKYTM